MADEIVPTIADLLREGTAMFRDRGVATPELDARLLVADAEGLGPREVTLRSERPIGADPALVRALFSRRLTGEPVHRIIGRRAFYDHEFELSADTLEPRPDTETLVDEARSLVSIIVERRGACLFADIGTGTGAIAISLLALFGKAHGIAVDIVPGALQVAGRNAARAGVGERLRATVSNYLDAIDEPLDIVVSNPPYIRSGDMAALDPDVRDFDPSIALDGGPDGLDAYRAIATGSRRILRQDGFVVVEIGRGQENDVERIFAEQGFGLEKSAHDLGGVLRVMTFGRG